MSLVFIALGANLASQAGPPAATLAAAAERLTALGRIAARSSLYSTEPVGYAAQPRFVNAVLALATELSPRMLLATLLSLEDEFGRTRDPRLPNGPRTLDLDLLFYDDLVLGEPGLEVPHPRLAGRAFVLVPLCEIAPNLRDPRSGRTVTQLIEHLQDRTSHDAVNRLASSLWTVQALSD